MFYMYITTMMWLYFIRGGTEMEFLLPATELLALAKILYESLKKAKWQEICLKPLSNQMVGIL